MALSPVRLRASMSVGSADTIAFTRSNSPALIASMKPAASGIGRFYLLIICSLAPGVARAQVPLPEQPLLGSTFTADLLRALPATNNPLAVLEAVQVETISGRVPSGGLDIAPAPAVGGLLNSWTQTQFRIGDVSITDPRAGGTPLMLPFLPLWDRVTVPTGALEADDSAPGLSISLEPPRPGATWLRSAEGSLSGSALVSR